MAVEGRGVVQFWPSVANMMVIGCLMLVGCGQHDVSVKTSGRHSSAQTRDAADVAFLMPYLDGPGIALVCAREEFGGLEFNLLSYPEGVPIRQPQARNGNMSVPIEPTPPDIAIWRDRSIVWATETEQGDKTFWIGRVGAEEYEDLLTSINAIQRQGTSPESVVANRMPPSSNVISSIAVVASDYRCVFGSELPQMQRLQTYWYFDEGRFIELPMGDYSFEAFLAKLPPVYAQDTKTYKELCSTLRCLIPSERREIDVSVTLSWVIQRGAWRGQLP
ncbi:MAG: hypothetical protein R3C99_00335 [Pirellulaceae bacterium]